MEDLDWDVVAFFALIALVFCFGIKAVDKEGQRNHEERMFLLQQDTFPADSLIKINGETYKLIKE